VAAAAGQEPDNPRPPKAKFEVTQEAIRLETATGVLEGTLDLPKRPAPMTVALILAGSGPTDRDGNQVLLRNDCLKLLGQGLAEQGIAVVRFDKRGVGQSIAAARREQDLRLETYVEDAAAWMKMLRGDPRFQTLAVIGHSEGALIGMLASKQVPPDAFVSIAGAGRDAPTVLREQLQGKLSAELSQAAEEILQALVAGRTVDNVPKDLMALFRPSVQPYLISWFRYDPSRVIAELDLPILIVQGSTDLQISVDDAKRLAQAAKRGRLLVLEGTNHVLKKASNPLEQQLAYGTRSYPLDPRVVEEIARFLHEVPAPQKGPEPPRNREPAPAAPAGACRGLDQPGPGKRNQGSPMPAQGRRAARSASTIIRTSCSKVTCGSQPRTLRALLESARRSSTSAGR
jgi:pimeloyl-ACP methyl ester carboxylesterase